MSRTTEKRFVLRDTKRILQQFVKSREPPRFIQISVIFKRDYFYVSNQFADLSKMLLYVIS